MPPPLHCTDKYQCQYWLLASKKGCVMCVWNSQASAIDVKCCPYEFPVWQFQSFLIADLQFKFVVASARLQVVSFRALAFGYFYPKSIIFKHVKQIKVPPPKKFCDSYFSTSRFDSAWSSLVQLTIFQNENIFISLPSLILITTNTPTISHSSRTECAP